MPDNILRPDPGTNDERLYPAGYTPPIGDSVVISGGGTLTASGTQGAPGVSSLNGTLKAYISEINDIFIGNINKINSV